MKEGIQENHIYQGDVLEVLKTFPDEIIDCVVTSPPYWGLRDYGAEGQIGLEQTPGDYTEKMRQVFNECKRVLKKDGTLWLNLGDSYYNYRPGSTSQTKQTLAGSDGKVIEYSAKRGEKIVGLKEKDLVGIPWRVAFALQADGWYLRQDIVWAKPNPMPESVTDRCTKSHEYIFLMSKSKDYFFDHEAIKEKAVWDIDGTETEARKERSFEGMKSYPEGKRNGIRPRQFGATKPEGTMRQDVGRIYEDTGKRNKRSVWTVNTKPYSEAHFATFNPELIIPCIRTTRPDAIILDPFMGSGTTAFVARGLGRKYIGIELNPEYIKIAEKRLSQKVLF